MSWPVVLLTVTNFVAMGAGFLREMAVAYRFGTSAASDAFAVTLLLIEGVITLAVSGLGAQMMVPIVSGITGEDSQRSAYALMQTLCLWLTLVSLPFGLIALLWPGTLAHLLGCPDSASADFSRMTQAKYEGVFSKAGSPEELLSAVKAEVATDAPLAQACRVQS